MKARLLLAIPLMVGVALAQEPAPAGSPAGNPQADRQSQPPAGSPAGNPQADRQSQPPAASPAGESQADRQAAPAQAEPKTESKPAAGSADIPQMKTMSYKGVLVDLACGAATASAGAGASDTPSASASAGAGAGATAGGSPAATQSDKSTPAPAASSSASANRSAGDSNCAVTASSSQLGLKMDDGKVVRFDLVGNQRAQDELKANKKWTAAVTAKKPINVKISGVLQGDKLIVSSIH